MPDYFVPIDTTLYTKYHRHLRDKGALMKAHFHFIDAHILVMFSLKVVYLLLNASAA